ncbi:FeS-binding protein [Streptomyces cinnamoneus]|uniref:Cytochrome bc1 complex Rieske iron-sulfur subunit n=1 Tax=Streptomyces cinnamoneus TaxID=53446 RepID=A0A2G1XBN8_STRCJ|nr:Rieske (2Fe-2S) protein [Streptomyces cinnamoneus]PHQ48628.1 FeS-binding protein [Streptomyces cinnamoneus]PPT12693.1 FeS-binding protein [Streptomyces cinnamoneus]
MSSPTASSASRRTVLRGAALAGVAGLGASACSGGAGAKGPAVPTAPVDLGAAGEVPVGGARLYREQRLIVAQPVEGQYKAFSAVCTHAGCVVDKIEDGKVNCPCHGSKFDAQTGKVLQGPAGAPLPSVPVKADGGKLVAGPDA